MIKYFAVIYSNDGTIHLWPGNTQADCLDKLRAIRDNPNWGGRVLSTTVIKRDMSNFKEGLIFGNPKSLNVMLERKSKC